MVSIEKNEINFLPNKTKTIKNKKPSLLRIHPSAARPSYLQRSAAFRPPLTRGLALSGLSFFEFFSLEGL
jgi:hypothetical protein